MSGKSDMKGIEKGLKVLGQFTGDTKEAMIEIMKIHPINSLILLNLTANLGFALLVEPDLADNPFVPGTQIESFKFKNMKFSSKQDMVAHVFRENAKLTGQLLTTDAIKDVFSFSLSGLSKVIGSVIP